MIRRILVPLDGSALAEQALPHALALAAAFESEVILLRVIASPPSRQVNSVDWRLQKVEVERYLEEVAKRLGDDSIVRLVATGNAPEQILAALEKHAVDLLVLSRHGEGGLTEFHLSGTASKLVGSARCSILLVTPGDPAGEAAGAAAYRKIVVPVDCSKRSEWAVSLAATLARAAGAELLLVHVVPPLELVEPAAGNPHALDLARELAEANREAARAYLKALTARLRGPDFHVGYRIVDNEHVGPTLLRFAAAEGPSVVVLSAHGHAPALGVSYGSIATALIADATAPVLIFQDMPPRPYAVGLAVATGRVTAGAGR